MTRSEHGDHEMDRDEDWFGEVCDDPEIRSIDAIKLRVRIEAGEQWLDKALRDDIPENLVTDSKHRVRQSLTETQQSRHRFLDGGAFRPVSRTFPMRMYLGLATLAAAASIVIFVSVYQPVESAIGLSFGEAFEAFREADVDLALDDVAGELATLELAFFEEADARWEDAQIDDLRQSIGSVWWDSVIDDDRS